MSWLRNYAKRKFDLYDIEDLQVGGNCGGCGVWIPDVILPKYWAWDLCNFCSSGSACIEENGHQLGIRAK